MKNDRLIERVVLRAILAFLFLAFTSAGWATTYYVDFNNGNDNNTGLTTANPLKHAPGDSNAISKAASTALVPGDIVAFKKGISYKGAINCSRWAGSVVDSGSTAAITRGGVLTDLNGQFQANGVSVSHYIYIYHSKTTAENTWVESCGLFKIGSVDSNTQLTLQDFDGVAHATAEMTYKIVNPIAYKSISAWGTGDAVIDGELTRTRGIITSGSQCIRIEDLKFSEIRNGTNGANGVAIFGDSNVHVVNCKFDNIGETATSLGPYQVVKGCRSTAVGYSTISNGDSRWSLFENNYSEGGTRTIRSGGKFMIIRYNHFKDITGAYQGAHADGLGPFDQGSSNDVEYFWIYGNIIDNSVELIALYGTGGLPRNFVIHSNVIIGRYAETGYGDAGFLVKSLSYGYFFNNTFVDPQGGGPFLHAIRLENDGSGYGTNHCCIKNNIYYSASTASIMRFDSGMLANHEVDYNHYYTASATPFRYDYPTSPGEEDYTTWKMHGYDSHSAANVTTDPKFVSVVGEDFHLQTSSPCIDTGTDLSRYFTLDKDRKPRARTGWDKGAYEFGSGAPPPLPPVGLRIVQ